MPRIYTVDYFANSYADRKMAEPIPQNVFRYRDNFVYDFKVTGFNLTTVATIGTVALAILVNSPFVLILALLVSCARNAFMRDLDLTGPNPNLRITDVNPNARRGALMQHLAINDANWQPVQIQLLGFRVWMNWTPHLVAEEGAANRAQPPAAVAAAGQAVLQPPPAVAAIQV